MSKFDTNRLALKISQEVKRRLPRTNHWRTLMVADMTDGEMTHWLKVRADVRTELGGAS